MVAVLPNNRPNPNFDPNKYYHSPNYTPKTTTTNTNSSTGAYGAGLDQYVKDNQDQFNKEREYWDYLVNQGKARDQNVNQAQDFALKMLDPNTRGSVLSGTPYESLGQDRTQDELNAYYENLFNPNKELLAQHGLLGSGENLRFRKDAERDTMLWNEAKKNDDLKFLQNYALDTLAAAQLGLGPNNVGTMSDLAGALGLSMQDQQNHFSNQITLNNQKMAKEAHQQDMKERLFDLAQKEKEARDIQNMNRFSGGHTFADAQQLMPRSNLNFNNSDYFQAKDLIDKIVGDFGTQGITGDAKRMEDESMARALFSQLLGEGGTSVAMNMNGTRRGGNTNPLNDIIQPENRGDRVDPSKQREGLDLSGSRAYREWLKKNEGKEVNT